MSKLSMHGHHQRFCFRLAAIFIAVASAGFGSAAEPVPPNKRITADYRRPELVAITWQQSTSPGEGKAKAPVWRPDGTLLDDVEAEWIRKDIESFDIHWWDTNNQLRPLALIFRIDERAKSPQTRASGSARQSTSHHLAISSLAPNRAELGAWSADIDVEIRVPIGEPEVVKTFDRLPDADLRIEDGVRWYVDHTRGIRTEGGRRKSGFKAAVLEIDDKQVDPLTCPHGRYQPLT